MKGKGVTAAANNGGKVNQTDLLVCFPSRAHLALMPRAICSPSRPAELPKRHHHLHHPTKHAGGGSSSHSRSSPLFKVKTRNTTSTTTDSSDIDEPTSPKVTCAGQIKVQRPTKPRSSNASSSRPSTENKNWISVVEEIERLRKKKDRNKKSKPKPATWLEAVGIKKDALQIFTSFHGLRFNMAGCFGSFPASIDCTSDEEDEDEESVAREEEVAASQDVFSKWFMLIEQNQDIDLKLKEEIVQDDEEDEEEKNNNMTDPAVPPPNALLLMRCRSAPAKGLLNRAEEVETTEETGNANEAKEEEENAKEKLVVMSYAPDFFKVSMDIAKETWVVGGEMDLLARSRSWKR